MKISVVVPTSGRWPMLSRCLASALGQERRPDEVLVIDNSPDGMPASLLPEGARLVREPRRGVVHARNRGLEEARGEVAAFLDDDCEAPAGWLAAVEACFQDSSVAAVGGPARAVWLSPPPRALLRSRALTYLGVQDFGSRRKPLDPARDYLMGGNLAIRLSALDGKRFVGVFPFPGFGQCAEDTEMTRYLAARHTVLYEPSAWVEHHISPEKLRWTRLAVRVFCMEAAAARMARPEAARQRTLAQKVLGVGLKAVQVSGRLCGALLEPISN